jgi:hypothetical protein
MVQQLSKIGKGKIKKALVRIDDSFSKDNWSDFIDKITVVVNNTVFDWKDVFSPTFSPENQVVEKVDLASETVLEFTKKVFQVNSGSKAEDWQQLRNFDTTAHPKSQQILEASANLAKIITADLLVQQCVEKYKESNSEQRSTIHTMMPHLIAYKSTLTTIRDRAKSTLPLYTKKSIFKLKEKKQFTDEAIAALGLDRLTSRPESVGYDVGVSITWPQAHSDSNFPLAFRALNLRFKSDPAVISVVDNPLTVNQETITLALAEQVERASALDGNGNKLSVFSEDKQYLYVPNGTYLAGTANEFVIAGISEATRHAINIQG